VNVVGLMTVTREFVKQMEERKCDDGHIININSVLGHRPPRGSVYAFYSATKYAVTALTEGSQSRTKTEEEQDQSHWDISWMGA
jgi:short-subunit dehydrogenase